MKKALSLALVLMLLLCGCSKKNSGSSNTSSQDNTSSDFQVQSEKTDAEMFTERDSKTEYDKNTAVSITLNGNTATATSDAVKISDSTVTISDEATYVITGTLSDGKIIVNAKDTDKPTLVFENVNVNSSDGAALYILEADKVFITLADGTANTLSNGGSFANVDQNNVDGAVFSKSDLTFNGSGSLTVISPVGHGIVCKDDLVFTGGSYTVNCSSHAVDANDSVRIKNSIVTATSGKDGIHCENNDDTALGFVYISGGTFNIDAQGDGISAGAYAQIQDGAFNIVSGGGSVNAQKQTSDSWGGFMGGRPNSSGRTAETATTTTDDSSTSIKGIKAAGQLTLNGGSFTIDSADDAIHSNNSITVNNGEFQIKTGDDGFHADQDLTVNSATINITESYEGLEALNIIINGGNIELVASDDGLNAAGGNDSSGFGGNRGGDMFGGHGGGMGGGMQSSSSSGSIEICGGEMYIQASGDGIDANGTLNITGGYTVVCGPTQGDTATLDYDVSATISGGTFIGTGASGMAQTFSDTKQGIIAISVGNRTAKTNITVKDNGGNTVLSYTPELSYAVFIVSSPDIITGEKYTVYIGSDSAEITAQ